MGNTVPEIMSDQEIAENLPQVKQQLAEMAARVAGVEEKLKYLTIFNKYIFEYCSGAVYSFPQFMENIKYKQNGNEIKYYCDDLFLEIKIIENSKTELIIYFNSHSQKVIYRPINIS